MAALFEVRSVDDFVKTKPKEAAHVDELLGDIRKRFLPKLTTAMSAPQARVEVARLTDCLLRTIFGKPLSKNHGVLRLASGPTRRPRSWRLHGLASWTRGTPT